MDQDDFKVEAYGIVTPPPGADGEPDEGDDEDDEES